MDIVKKNDIESYKISISGFCINISMSVLISLVICIIPLLLNKDTGIFYISQPLYIAVLLLYVTILYYRWWGLLIAALTFIICSFFIDMDIQTVIINGSVNLLQIFLLLIAHLGIKRIKLRNNNLYSKGLFKLSSYNFLISVLLIIYLSYCIVTTQFSQYVLILISAILFICTIIKSIIEKDIRLVYFTFIVAFVPSLICSIISVIALNVPNQLVPEYIQMWTLSNYILLQTGGYLIFQLLYTREKKMLKRKVHISLDISTIAFYLSIFVWNILILTLIDNDVIKFYSYIYFFPWALGNILLLINLYFSVYTESEFKEGDKFEWYEKRVIVVEKNTSTIITLISFMLPLTFSKLSQVPTILSIFFIANIFCTCLSMGLIWTPHTNIRFISALKTLKTIFYTYSITILMICIIMVMSNI